MNKHLLSFLLLLFFALCSAQTKRIDSLSKVLKIAKEDTNKVRVLNSLAMEFRNINPDTTICLGLLAKKLAEKLNYPEGVAEAYLWMGTAKANLADYTIALNYLTETIKVSKIKKTKARAYSNMGLVYYNQGNYPEALKNHFTSLQIKEEIGDNLGIASSYNNIGMVYADQDNYTDALKNYFASLKIKKELGDKNGVASTYNNIGLVYKEQGNYGEALKNYAAALKIREETGDQMGIAGSYNNIGTAYTDMGNPAEALKNYFISLKIKEELGDKNGTALSFINICQTYFDLKNYNEAKNYGIKGLSLARKIGSIGLLKSVYEILSEIYAETGMHKEALESYKNYVIARDSLINEENTKKTVQLEMQYEFDKKEAATKLEQEKKDAVAAAESKKQKLIIASVSAGLCLILILAVVILRSLRINQKKNKIITEQKELVERQKELVEEKQKEILDSIRYAKRIQTALLPSEKYISRNLNKN